MWFQIGEYGQRQREREGEFFWEIIGKTIFVTIGNL